VFVTVHDILSAIKRPPQGPNWSRDPTKYFEDKMKACSAELEWWDKLHWIVVIRWMRDSVIGTQCRGHESCDSLKVTLTNGKYFCAAHAGSLIYHGRFEDARQVREWVEERFPGLRSILSDFAKKHMPNILTGTAENI